MLPSLLVTHISFCLWHDWRWCNLAQRCGSCREQFPLCANACHDFECQGGNMAPLWNVKLDELKAHMQQSLRMPCICQ